MSLEIGRALRDGASRTTAKNGLILAAIFAGIALLTTVLFQSLLVAVTESMLEVLRSASPQELGLAEAEYEEAVGELEAAIAEVRAATPLALGISAGLAAGGLLVIALVAEAVSIVTVRIFSTDETETIPGDLVADNILLATLNGFVGKIVVWALILLGLMLFVIPGLILAVLFFFLRQEIAIKNKNFVQAMADSWRLTKGNRIEVFLVGAVLVIVSQIEAVTTAALDIVSTTGGVIGGALVGGIVGVFGAAVATRAYVQIDESGDVDESGVEPDDEPEDPYDAALGPDDLPR